MNKTFRTLFDFESALAEYTGAPYVVVTDGCTHALELCFRYDGVRGCKFTPFTYLSIPMIMHKLNIPYAYEDEEEQTWVGEYPIGLTRIWDSARRLEANMYKQGMMQRLSFGHGKPLHINRGGAILLDDEAAYHDIIRMRYDGRDLNILPWNKQTMFNVGYHYKPTIEEAQQGLALLEGVKENPAEPIFVQYPDLRTISIQE